MPCCSQNYYGASDSWSIRQARPCAHGLENSQLQVDPHVACLEGLIIYALLGIDHARHEQHRRIPVACRVGQPLGQCCQDSILNMGQDLAKRAFDMAGWTER